MTRLWLKIIKDHRIDGSIVTLLPAEPIRSVA